MGEPIVKEFRNQIDLNDLRSWVKMGEGQNLEFKLKSNHPERIIREIVAFANADGGRLLIGIADDGSIKGLKHVFEDEFILRNSIEKYIQPPVNYATYRVALADEREVLVFDVPESKEKPHYVVLDYKPENKIAYYRVNDKSVKASKELKEVLKGQRKSKSLRFAFGEKEKLLMEYLAKHEYITVASFAEIAKIPFKLASRTLILLCLTNVLKIDPKEIADNFVVY